MRTEADFVVIGGGIVGLSVAHGLLCRGQSVICLDGSDVDFRASRGNFGLVWVQGKGLQAPHYAAWSQKAVREYPDFVAGLRDDTGVEVSLQQNGGYEYFSDSDAMAERLQQFKVLKQHFSSPRGHILGDLLFHFFGCTFQGHHELILTNL